MMHTSRVHQVADVPDDELDQLAERLQSITHTSCSGYRWRGLLILNDATSENGAQEYAIVREATSRQIESLTCSWYADPVDLARTLEHLAADTHWEGGENARGNSNAVTTHLDHPAEPCRLCA